ncbi:MAG: hypothetical protein AAFW70_18300 [Cyanobacteria bacterium J06635_10]
MLETRFFVPEITKSSNKSETKIDNATLVSWLFLLGSLLFVLDAVLEIIEAISLHSIIHMSASLLFTIGSILFLPRNQQQ